MRFCEKKKPDAAKEKIKDVKKPDPKEKKTEKPKAENAKKEDQKKDEIKSEETKKEEIVETPKQEISGEKVELEDKYKKLLAGFTNDWQKISISSNEKINKNLTAELSNGQKEYIDVLTSKFIDLNIVQIQYFGIKLKDKVDSLRPLPLMRINKEWSKFTDKCKINLKLLVKFPLQIEDKIEYPQEKELMNQLKSWMLGGEFEGADAGAASSSEKKEEKEEKKEEKKEVN